MERNRMRTMHLPDVPVVTAQSADECLKLYLERLSADRACWPNVSMLLTAYVAWPNDEERRNGFAATQLLRLSSSANEKTDDASDSERSSPLEAFGGISAIAKPAFDQLTKEIRKFQRQWLLTSDIFQSIEFLNSRRVGTKVA
jgi:hypothetical protein